MEAKLALFGATFLFVALLLRRYRERKLWRKDARRYIVLALTACPCLPLAKLIEDYVIDEFPRSFFEAVFGWDKRAELVRLCHRMCDEKILERAWKGKRSFFMLSDAHRKIQQ